MHTSQGLDHELLRRERNDGSSHRGRKDEEGKSQRIIASVEENTKKERKDFLSSNSATYRGMGTKNAALLVVELGYQRWPSFVERAMTPLKSYNNHHEKSMIHLCYKSLL